MKKQLLFLALIAVFLSCEKNEIGDFGPSEFSEMTNSADNKRGVAFTNNSQRWSHKTSEMNAHWMYSWGNVLRDEVPENVEYVPMFWGAGSVNDANIERLIQLKNEGKIKYIMGFNEPDGASQANMTVDQAIELWPRLEEIGLPLISPATVDPLNPWMREFMERADALGYRIDIIALHSYGGINVGAFIKKLKDTYNAYGNRPIWITEFAVADWNATSPANNRYSEAQVMNFMAEVLPALDAIEWIHRYAWFSGVQAPLRSSALFDEDNMITPVGQLYASISPNLIIGPGVDTEFIVEEDENELIVNGGFETGQITPWQGFKNDVQSSATTEPHSGNFSGRLQNNDASLFQETVVEPGQTYVLRFWSKWIQEVPNTFSASIRDRTGGVNNPLFSLPPMPQTDVWEETVYEFTVPEGVTDIRIVFFKGQVNPTFPAFFLDDVSLKVKE
jgi:hypothetical protein